LERLRLLRLLVAPSTSAPLLLRLLLVAVASCAELVAGADIKLSSPPPRLNYPRYISSSSLFFTFPLPFFLICLCIMIAHIVSSWYVFFRIIRVHKHLA
jgi:hypothetical protein